MSSNEEPSRYRPITIDRDVRLSTVKDSSQYSDMQELEVYETRNRREAASCRWLVSAARSNPTCQQEKELPAKTAQAATAFGGMTPQQTFKAARCATLSAVLTGAVRTAMRL